MHQFFCANSQKHLGMYLGESLSFTYHIKEKMSKAIKGIGIIKKLNKTLPRYSLITIYCVYNVLCIKACYSQYPKPDANGCFFFF